MPLRRRALRPLFALAALLSLASLLGCGPEEAEPPTLTAEARQATRRSLEGAYLGDFVGIRRSAAGASEEVRVQIALDSAATLRPACGNSVVDLRCVTTADAVLPVRLVATGASGEERWSGQAVAVVVVPEGEGARTDAPSALESYLTLDVPGGPWRSQAGAAGLTIARPDGTLAYELARPTK